MLGLPTYAELLQRMINRVAETYPGIDTREGSIIHNALAPAALELRNVYVMLETVLNETFADTASREMLIKRAAERGLAPYSATKAIAKGEFTPVSLPIAIGTRFNLRSLNWIVTERISAGVYRMECETEGAAGNNYTGALIPIEYVDGLETAQLTEILIPGEDEEDTEVFRQRYFSNLNAQAFGGNIADYKEKVGAIPGIGGVKIYPVWQGGGTVRIVISDSDYSVPTDVLITEAQTLIDPLQNQGKGIGFAPIGHIVTVNGVSPFIVNIDSNITYRDGWSWDGIKPYAEDAIDGYFKELAAVWDNEDNLIVRVSQIEMRFLNLPGVVDIADTKLNGTAQNLMLGQDDIPVRGELSG